MSSGKSYRAILPLLSDEEQNRLQAWADMHCATSVLLRVRGEPEKDCVVWLATRERPRTREAFMRSIRATLKKMDIDPSRLRGTWLVLADDDVVSRESRLARAAGAEDSPLSRYVATSSSRPLASKPPNVTPPPAPQEDVGERVIRLTGKAQSRSACIQVVKV